MKNIKKNKKNKQGTNDNIIDDYTMYDNVIDFQEYQLNRLITRLCVKYHHEENSIMGLVMKNVELGVTKIHIIEQNIEDFMQVKAAQRKP